MSFIAKNPLSLPEIRNTPSTPPGTRGIFAKEDGWYEIDSNGVVKKLANFGDLPTKATLGLDRVDNTPDNEKIVKQATTADEATMDAEGNTIHETYATKGALKTVESIAKGANQAESFDNYASMVDALNELPTNSYNTGQNIMIVTLEVPDLWVSNIADTSVIYTYTTDEAVVNELKENGRIQVGYYVLSMLETQKADLTQYPTKDELENGEVIPVEAFFASVADEATYAIQAGFDAKGNEIHTTYVDKNLSIVTADGARKISAIGFTDKVATGDTVGYNGIVKQGQTIYDILVPFPDGVTYSKDDEFEPTTSNDNDEILLEALDGSDFINITSKMLRNNPYTCNTDFRIVHTGHTRASDRMQVQDSARVVIDGEVKTITNKISTKFYVDNAIRDVESKLSTVADKELTNVTDKGLENITSREFALGELREVSPQDLKAGDVIVDFKAACMDTTGNPKPGEEGSVLITKDNAIGFDFIFADNSSDNYDEVTSLPYAVGDMPYVYDTVTYIDPGRPNQGSIQELGVNLFIVCDGVDKIATTKEVKEKVEDIETALNNIDDQDLTNVTDQGLNNITSREFGETTTLGLMGVVKAGQIIFDFRAHFYDGTIGTKDGEYVDDVGAENNELIFNGGDIFLTSKDLPYTSSTDMLYEWAGFRRVSDLDVASGDNVELIVGNTDKIATTNYVGDMVGDIETTLDTIIAEQEAILEIQESLYMPDAEGVEF